MADVRYVPGFVSASEARYLVGRIRDQPACRWTALPASGRRCQRYGGAVDGKAGGVVGGVEELPPWLEELAARIKDAMPSDHPKPNHVLVNEYEPGAGVLPHEDGPLYAPAVATLSLGSPCVVSFIPTDETRNKAFQVALMPNSLLVFKGEAYKAFRHGIDGVHAHALPAPDELVNHADPDVLRALERTEDGGVHLRRSDTRYSLTFRRVRSALKWAAVRR